MIYLDIDGVLILSGQTAKHADVRKRAAMVARLARDTQKSIVVCSHRRISDDVQVLLKDLGLADYLAKDNWKTPFIADPDPDLSIRGQEIDAHLRNSKPDRHVILDDDFALAHHNHVQIDQNTGITKNDLDKARGFLIG